MIPRLPSHPSLPARVRIPAVLGGLWLAFAMIYQCGVPLRSTYGSRVNVDEPFYLLTTVSLIEDGDLDLTNDYALERYRTFFDLPQGLWYQSVPGPEGHLLSPHNAGLPFLLQPAYRAGGVDGAKSFLALLGAGAVSLAALLAYRLTGAIGASAAAAIALGSSAPWFVYATQVYPEMPAAVALLGGVLALTVRRPSWSAAVLVAASSSALLWLGAKYGLLAAILTLGALRQLDVRGRVTLVALLIPSGITYAAFHLALYGGLTPYTVNALYAGSTDLELVERHFSLLDRAYRLGALWWDRQFGLVHWAPVLLLAIPGLLLPWSRSARLQWLTLSLCGAQLLVATFLSITMRGWWFPGRMLIVALPLLVPPLAAAFSHAQRMRRRPILVAAALLSSMTASTTIALWATASQGRIALAVNPFDLPWAPFQAIAVFFPDYTVYDAWTWLLTAAWVAAAALLLLGQRLHVLHRIAFRAPAGSRQAAVPAPEAPR